MSEHHDTQTTKSARERELEIEIGRLQAEVDTLKGEDPTAATSRFLAMAAATVDQAVEQARREADEIVEEISAQAEARRDEATRVAAEAEAMAETLLAEADRAQETIDEAHIEAESIKSTAKQEAEILVEIEREKVTEEIEALAELQTVLESERGALETYHEDLQKRVQELAESMVSFMTTELPVGSASAIENLAAPQLESILAENLELDEAAETVDEPSAESVEDPWAVPPAETTEADGDALETTPVDPWSAMLSSAIPEVDEADIFDMPESAVGEVPDGPPTTFADRDILEPEEEDDMKPTSAGLFSRARMDDAADVTDVFDDLASDFDRPVDGADAGLFSMLGSRLVEQAESGALADALDESDEDDHAFREFIDGDDEPDPSRDWLLRPEKG